MRRIHSLCWIGCNKICTNHLLQLLKITGSSMTSVASLSTQRSKPCCIIQHKHIGFIIAVPQRGILAWDTLIIIIITEVNQRWHNAIRGYFHRDPNLAGPSEIMENYIQIESF